MKNNRLPIRLVICCGISLMLSVSAPADDAVVSPARPSMTTRLESIVTPGVRQCGEAVAGAPEPTDLQGVWRGVVEGGPADAPASYFWIIDAVNEEGLMLARRAGATTLPDGSEIEDPPTLTVRMCPSSGYTHVSNQPRRHVFTKVSHYIGNARDIVEEATGTRFPPTMGPLLSHMWDELVASDHFRSLPKALPLGGASEYSHPTVHGTEGGDR